MSVVFVGDILLVDGVCLNPLPVILEPQNSEETAEEVGREFTRDLEQMTGIIRTQQHLTLMSLGHCVTFETILISTLLLTQLTVESKFLKP